MKKSKIIVAAALTVFFATQNSAFAQSSSTSVSGVENSENINIEDLQKENKKPPGEDQADQIITNKLMRAQTGSLSKWSISTALGFNGGTVQNPLSPIRPNISSGNATQTALQSLGGTIGVKYRLTDVDSLTVNGGVRMFTPFTNSYNTSDAKIQAQFDKQRQKADLYDPNLMYIHLAKFLGAQNIFQLTQTYITESNLSENLGYLTATDFQHTIAWEVGSDKHLTLGFNYELTFNTFYKSSPDIASGQTDLYIGLFPYAEYVLTDMFNLRTVLGYQYEHLRSFGSITTLHQDDVFQSVGVGIALGRDVFLYPNLQFTPSNIRGDRTNVALSTNINLF